MGIELDAILQREHRWSTGDTKYGGWVACTEDQFMLYRRTARTSKQSERHENTRDNSRIASTSVQRLIMPSLEASDLGASHFHMYFSRSFFPQLFVIYLHT